MSQKLKNELIFIGIITLMLISSLRGFGQTPNGDVINVGKINYRLNLDTSHNHAMWHTVCVDREHLINDTVLWDICETIPFKRYPRNPNLSVVSQFEFE